MDKRNGLNGIEEKVNGNNRELDFTINNSNMTNQTRFRNDIEDGRGGSKDDKEQGQIQDVIGHFGKYQLLIFIFKILIGVTSAFNNLSVTFFAPSDFIGYTCVIPNKLSNNSLHNQQQQQQHLIQQSTILNSTASILNLKLSPDHEHNVHHLDHHQSTPNPTAAAAAATSLIELNNPSTNNNNFMEINRDNNNNTQISINNNELNKSTKSNNNLFYEFLFSEERKLRHKNGFNTDTPKNLKKECEYYSNEDNSMHKCKKFNYNKGIWLSTIIDEWDLVCDRAWFISMTQSLYMSGFIVSFLVFGYISDRFGRWRSLLFGGLIEVLSGFGCAFASSVTSFMIFRFLLGLGNAGRSSSSYLIMIEWAGPKWRMHISTLGSLGWVIGYCSMPWITLFFLNFRHMQLFVCFYELLFIIWLLRLPESPRWLLTHKKFNEAYDVLLMAAKFNGLIRKESTVEQQQQQQKSLSSPLKNKFNNYEHDQDQEDESRGERLKLLKFPYTIEQFNVKFKHLINTIDAKDFTKNEDNLSIIDLFKWNNLRKYAFILYFVWASNSFIYYGIVLRVGSFGGKNLFKTFTIAGITELPSMAFTILCMKFMPRKTTNLFIFITTGLLCSIQLPLKYYNYQWLQQSTMLLAKLFNSCSFTVILYQTMELFPTSIRQTAYSSCSLAGRIGSILAPFIKELAQATNDSVPPVIYASLSAIAAFLITDLPETKGLDLPDTLLEAEKMEDLRMIENSNNNNNNNSTINEQQTPTSVVTNAKIRK